MVNPERGGHVPSGGVSVAEFGLGIQAWLGIDPYDPHRVERVAWPTQPTEKPARGFFTSTWDGRISAWIEFYATTPRAAIEFRTIFLLQPDPHAVLYVIESPDDFDALSDAHPQSYENPHRAPCPHWAQLAAEGPFDAVHMTAAAVSNKTLWYAHRWETESTLWFRPKLTLVGQGS